MELPNMITIGINEGINSSVVVARDGEILFALQEERVNRIKEFIGFPHGALDMALQVLKLDPGHVRTVCFSNLVSPRTTKEAFQAYQHRTAMTVLERLRHGDLGAPATLLPPIVRRALSRRSGEVADSSNSEMERALARHGLAHAEIRRTHHHLNHAASAYFGCRKNAVDPHLVLTLDGGGDDACAQVYVATEGQLKLLSSTPLGHSLGNVYARVTYAMGMRPHEHEYKLMGLAAYASREHCKGIAERFRAMLDLDPADTLRFRRRMREETTHIVPRLRREFRHERFDNLAGGLQFYTEDLMTRWVACAMERTGVRKVVAAGGVFMNVKANKAIAELPGIEYFDVFPSCGDETLPFGAVWLEHALRSGGGADIRFSSFHLGPEGSYDLQAAVVEHGDRIEVRRMADPDAETADLLSEGKVVARCSGKMEFGARALGNRSILADPADYRVINRINRMIKQRDFWMPFAPAMLAERAAEYVRIPPSLPRDRLSPWMMHTFDTTDEREGFSAGVHQYDLTARAQMVSVTSAPRFYRLIKAFEQRTGRAVVLNTSFNLHGFPIVLGANDAIKVLLASGLDHLVIDDSLITKKKAS